MTKFSFLTSAIFTFIVGATSTFSGSAQAQVFNGDFTAVPPESTHVSYADDVSRSSILFSGV